MKKSWNRYETDELIEVTVTKIFKERVSDIKYKKGFSNKSIVTDKATVQVYAKILFKLLELIILDVIEGKIVYFNKKIGSKFYVDSTKASPEMIAGKGIKEDMKIPLIDFKATNYKVPLIIFDPGYKDAKVAKVLIPYYLYSYLIDSVNAGKKYSKGIKKHNF